MKKIFMMVGAITVLLILGACTSDEKADDMGEKAILSKIEKTEDGKYLYNITNFTDSEVVFEFTSSQRFDYAIATKEGEQVYLFSSLAMFMQTLGEEKLASKKELSYEIDINELGLSPGDYTLEAWLTPKNGKEYLAKTIFSIE